MDVLREAVIFTQTVDALLYYDRVGYGKLSDIYFPPQFLAAILALRGLATGQPCVAALVVSGSCLGGTLRAGSAWAPWTRRARWPT